MSSAGVILGRKKTTKTNPLRKLASLIQLITEILFLLVVPFLLMPLLLNLTTAAVQVYSYLPYFSFIYLCSNQSFCISCASVDFMASFICDFSSRVNEVHGQATCLFWHILE